MIKASPSTLWVHAPESCCCRFALGRPHFRLAEKLVPTPLIEPVSVSSTPHHPPLVNPQACMRHNPEQRPLASEVLEMLAAAPSEHVAPEDTSYVRLFTSL